MYKVYVDAATKGNPGVSGIGILILHEKKQEQFSLPLGIMTNHEAEFLAVIEALKILKTKNITEEILLFTDSKLVVTSWGKKQVANPKYQELLWRLLMLERQFPKLTIQWFSDKSNQGAHQLAQQGLQKAKKQSL